MSTVKSLAESLNSLSESWRPGGKTDQGKKDGLPDVDYWRSVQGQRIGFVGSPGSGRPITGSDGARDALLGGGGMGKFKFDEQFRQRLKKLDKREGALTAEQYKSAMDSAASKAEDEISRILSEAGISRDDFESSLSKPSGSSLAAPVVMERLAESLASTNKEKYGEPSKDGKAYGFPISYKNTSKKFRDGGLGSAVNDWQALCAPSIADPDASPDRRGEMVKFADAVIGKPGTDKFEKFREWFDDIVGQARDLPADDRPGFLRKALGVPAIYTLAAMAADNRVTAEEAYYYASGTGGESGSKIGGSFLFDLSGSPYIDWGSNKRRFRGAIAMMEKFDPDWSGKVEGGASYLADLASAMDNAPETLSSKECEIKYSASKGRAYASTNQKKVDANLYYKKDAMGVSGKGAPMTKDGYHRRVLFHELSHGLESRDPGLRDASIRFLEDRVGKEKPRRLSNLTGSKFYASNEWAFSDKFADPYIGKVYSGDSEVTSMAFEAFSSGSKMAALYRDDRDLFHYAVAVATGAFKEAKKNG
jgi:hypothetical protein